MTRVSRLALPVVLVAFCGFCAWFALGVPDIGAVQGFESSTYATPAGALAAVVLLAWIPVVALGIAVLIMMGRAAWLGVDAAEWTRRRRYQVAAVLALGAVVLGVGIARHFETTPVLHGGSVAQAQHLLKEHK